MTRTMLAVLFALLLPSLAGADPVAYALERERSVVGFAWDFGRDEIRGRMPVAAADITIDFDDVRNSRVDVSVDVAHAEAGFPFATQAMKGPKVLDAARFPFLRFRSRSVRKVGAGAEVAGDLTVRGVTRPVVFYAEIYRQRGTDEGDRDRMSVLVSGALSRRSFGATGWSDLAGDEVRLNILARLRRAG